MQTQRRDLIPGATLKKWPPTPVLLYNVDETEGIEEMEEGGLLLRYLLLLVFFERLNPPQAEKVLTNGNKRTDIYCGA
jgi:hypothetical protein